MASHFYFQLGPKDGLMPLFIEYLTHLSEWCWNDYMTSNRSDLAVQIAKLEDLVQRGEEALSVFSPEEASVIDRLTEEFIGLDDLCGREGRWHNVKSPLGKTVGYFNINGLDTHAGVHIEKFGTEELFKLWNYIPLGRSLSRGSTEYIYSRKGAYRVGYWTLSEVGLLQTELTALSQDKKFQGTVANDNPDLAPEIIRLIDVVVVAVRRASDAGRGIVFHGH